MSVELRQLKDAVTGQPFVPVTHWDAVSNKPNIDGSLNSINASLNALDASVNALDASIKALDASIKNIGVYQDPTSKKVYIEGIGGFDGTNSSSSQSLEEYLEGIFRNISSHINELIVRVEALENK